MRGDVRRNLRPLSFFALQLLSSYSFDPSIDPYLGRSREAVAAQVRRGDGHEVRRPQARHQPLPRVVQLANGVARDQAALLGRKSSGLRGSACSDGSGHAP